MKCPHCNREHSDDALFCEYTGKKLEPLKPQLKACTNEDCPDSGKHILPAEAKFCPRCGRAIKGASNEISYESGSNSKGGHEYVDLGLSVKWATCNVGATQPHEYGDYFAWGETYTKDEYYTDNSDTYEIDMEDISGDPDYDAATANWGGSWRLPTQDEMEELVNECTWRWIRKNGVNGYKVTGPNGNSIFLPAAGYCRGSSRYGVGEDGGYWSSTPDEGYTGFAYDLRFDSGGHNVDWNFRLSGHTVRPVTE